MSDENTVLVPTETENAFDIASQPLVIGDERSFAESLMPELAEIRAEKEARADKSEAIETISDSGKGEQQNVPPEVTELVELIGIEGIKNLTEFISADNPIDLISPNQRENIVWSCIDDANVQATLLNDENVKQAISNHYFGGHDLDEVAAAVNASFQPTPEYQAQKAEREQLTNEVTRSTQLAIFHDSALQVANRFGLDLNDPKNQTAVDAWTREVQAFAFQHLPVIDQAIQAKMSGNNFFYSVSTSKLSNMFTAHMVRLCEQLTKGKPATNQKVQKVAKEVSRKTETTDYADLSEHEVMRSFLQDFKNTARERGLMK